MLTEFGLVSSLGSGKAQTWQNLFGQPQQVMSQSDAYIAGQSVALGAVNHTLPDMSPFSSIYHSRCNGLALIAYEQIQSQVEQAIEQYGAHRVGVVIGTSTSGTREAEDAFNHYNNHGHLSREYHYEIQEMGSPARFVAQISGSEGLAFCISTACSSGAKALVSAHNMINSGMLDAVICGGVDSLCKLTVNGFNALESLSKEICNPFSANRQGINIGECAALFLMQRAERGVALAGFGESSDAHHMSAPHPQGDGALSSMQKALNMASIDCSKLDYINLHGTATEKNDAMEAQAITRLGAAKVPASSTKPFTGHTLAGAGAIEAAICCLAMSDINTENRLPPHWYDGEYDSQIAAITLASTQPVAPVNYCLSNSFAFGGSNVSLVLARCYE